MICAYFREPTVVTICWAHTKKIQTFYKLFDRYIQIALAIGSVLSIKEFLFLKKYNFFNIVKIRYVPAEKIMITLTVFRLDTDNKS